MKLLANTAASTLADSPLAPSRRQAALITLAVMLAHASLLTWLQNSPGPVQPPQLAIVTMELLTSSTATVQDSKPAPPAEPRPHIRPTPKLALKPAPSKAQAAVMQPLTQAEPSPLPATTSSLTGSSSSSATAAPAATASGPANPASPVKVELPSASADYLNNPKPAYPPLSRRLREEGKVVLHVLIETDGSASRAEIRSSSGYERLDLAALQTVLKWRYVPARRNGTPEAMWFNVPINFVLE